MKYPFAMLMMAALSSCVTSRASALDVACSEEIDSAMNQAIGEPSAANFGASICNGSGECIAVLAYEPPLRESHAGLPYLLAQVTPDGRVTAKYIGDSDVELTIGGCVGSVTIDTARYHLAK